MSHRKIERAEGPRGQNFDVGNLSATPGFFKLRRPCSRVWVLAWKSTFWIFTPKIRSRSLDSLFTYCSRRFCPLGVHPSAEVEQVSLSTNPQLRWYLQLDQTLCKNTWRHHTLATPRPAHSGSSRPGKRQPGCGTSESGVSQASGSLCF